MDATAAVLAFPQRTIWPLGSAVDLALDHHWKGTRKYATMLSWCRELVETFPDKALFTFTTQDVVTWTEMQRMNGLSSWTIHAKVCLISTLFEVAKEHGYTGQVPSIPRPRVQKPLKWWLTPEKEQEVILWLRARGLDEFADFVLWQVETGLRVEETMRLRSGHFNGLLTDAPEVTVPGTKTQGSQATLALSATAGALAVSRYMALGAGLTGPAAMPLFPMDYRTLVRRWNAVRRHFGWTDEPTCTLKALRRSFARRLTVNGAPLPVVQGMMRHRSASTTMGYLALVGGGFTAEEQRRWL